MKKSLPAAPVTIRQDYVRRYLLSLAAAAE